MRKQKEADNDIFVLKISSFSNKKMKHEHHEFKTYEEAQNYARNHAIKILNLYVVIFKLFEKSERVRFNWCHDFNDIFIYDKENKRLSIKNPDITSQQLYKLTHAVIFDDYQGFKILKVIKK